MTTQTTTTTAPATNSSTLNTTKLSDLQAVLDSMSDDDLAALEDMVRVARVNRAVSAVGLPATPAAPTTATPPASYVGNVFSAVMKGSGLQHDSRWNQWAKWIDRVDQTKSDGYCFVGNFINDGTIEVKGGKQRLVLVKRTTGSRAHQNAQYRVVIWHPDGSVTPTDLQTDDSPGWALRLRDATASVLASLA